MTERGVVVDDKADLPALVKDAQQALGLHPSSTTPGPDGNDAVKRFLGGVSSVAIGVGELRNRRYGTGHGAPGVVSDFDRATPTSRSTRPPRGAS